MQLNVRIESHLPAIVEGAISFETGASLSQVQDPSLYAYEHHGVEFSALDRSALVQFYEQLILGRPLPATLATHRVRDVDVLMAITLFLNRDLATLPSTPELVYTIDFTHRLGLPALAHIEEAKARFISSLRSYFPEKLSQRELSERVIASVGWIKEYLQQGTLPILGVIPNTDLTILNQGDAGSVLASTTGSSLWDGWVELYRLGFLHGILFQYTEGDRKRVMIARKSHYVPLDLNLACRLLNQMELKFAGDATWTMTSELWLEHARGTELPVSRVREVVAQVTQIS